MCGWLASSATVIESKRMFRNLSIVRFRFRSSHSHNERIYIGKARVWREGTRDVLVDRFEGSCDGEIVLEFDGDALVGERLEDGEDELQSIVRRHWAADRNGYN